MLGYRAQDSQGYVFRMYQDQDSECSAFDPQGGESQDFSELLARPLFLYM